MNLAKGGARPPQVEPNELRLRGKRFEIDGEEFAVLVLPAARTSSIVDDSLTKAERAVVELVLRGLSNDEVAAMRGCSARTVANHLQAIYGKLKVASRVELAHLVGNASS